MSDEKKKGGRLGKLIAAVVILIIAAYGGWFAYAKATGDPNC